jgi:pimeloyl-ACP methyl ester carboxylesterase
MTSPESFGALTAPMTLGKEKITAANTPRRAYADTPDGQVHYRVAGTGEPIVLMHWAPSSGRQHSVLLVQLAARGFCAIAPDLMGYGDSDKPDRQWSIGDYSRNLGDLLDALELSAVYLYGGHTTAAVATEFAVTSPSRVQALALDGSPVYDAAQRAAFAGSYALPLQLETDGSHMLWAWQRSLRSPTMPLEEVFADCVDLLKAGHTYHTGYEAVWAYDMAARLPLLTVPTVAMTTPDDPLADAHQQVMAAVPGCQEFVGPARASQTVVERAALAADFLEEFCRSQGPDKLTL